MKIKVFHEAADRYKNKIEYDKTMQQLEKIIGGYIKNGIVPQVNWKIYDGVDIWYILAIMIDDKRGELEFEVEF